MKLSKKELEEYRKLDAEFPVEHLAHRTKVHGGFHASILKRTMEGRTIKNIATATKAKRNEIRQALKRLGLSVKENKTWQGVSEQEISEIVKRFKNKETISKIARDLKRAQSTIKDHLIKNGLIKREDEPRQMKEIYGKCSCCGVEIVSNYAKCNYCMYKYGE